MEQEHFKRGDSAIVDPFTYNSTILECHGLKPKDEVLITDVETSEGDLHPQKLTVRLSDGKEHSFSGIFFRQAPGTHTN